MRVGIVTPVVVRLPGAHAEWEATAGIEEIAGIAATADRLGYHHLTCSEHVAVPAGVAEQRGGTYWDPLATFGHLAAYTRRILLATRVLVLGYHHPLEIAKRYGTLDRLSAGRLVLGVGVGSLAEEFDLLGVPFRDRGARADEALRALRSSLGERVAEFHGTYYDYADMVVDPHATRRSPIWVGGRTARSLRRAVEHGDGWVPFGLRTAEVGELLSRFAPPTGFEVVLSTGTPLDPLADRDRTLRALDRLRAAGATLASVSLHATSAAHHRDQLAALRDLDTELDLSFAPRA